MQKNTIHFKHFLFSSLLIVAFVFCAAAEIFAAGVSLSAVPNAQTVAAGQAASYTIKINRTVYTDKVTLSAANLPAGVTATFTPNTTTANSSTLKLQTSIATPTGTFSITVKATANGITIAPIDLSLTVNSAPSIAVSVNPDTQYIVAGQTAVYDISLARTNYSGTVKLTAENLPFGISAVFEPETTAGNSTRMYLYSNGLAFLPKEYSMIVRVRGIADTVEGFKDFKAVVNCGIIWAEQFGTPDNQTQNRDLATAITFDSVGNVYAVGDTYTNKDESWVAKFDRNGVKLWVQRFSFSSMNTFAKDVAVDSAGNVYVAGYFRTSSNFVNFDAFIAKFTNSGTFILSNSLGGNREDGSGGVQLGFDASGNVMLASTVNIIGGGLINYSIDRAVYNSNFVQIGTTRLVNQKLGKPADFTIGSDGSIYVTGDDNDGVGFVGFAEKFNTSGNTVWRENFRQGTQPFPGRKIAADSNGNAFVALFNEMTQDSSIVKLSAAHQQGFLPSWTHIESPNRAVRLKALTVDSSNNVVFGGVVDGDALVGKLSGASGVSMLRHEYSVADVDAFNAIKTNANNEFFIAGETVGFKNVNFGNLDALVMKYSANGCIPF
ncbi:MAG TPA: SBBP repeat-containing protein [Pyrinomonadaceae bacterium]|nr:SBBP repeat-containing protein [Pyrinomonadaceae bacterium]